MYFFAIKDNDFRMFAFKKKYVRGIKISFHIWRYVTFYWTYYFEFEPYNAVKFPVKDNVNKRNFSFRFQYFPKRNFSMKGLSCVVFMFSFILMQQKWKEIYAWETVFIKVWKWHVQLQKKGPCYYANKVLKRKGKSKLPSNNR